MDGQAICLHPNGQTVTVSIFECDQTPEGSNGSILCSAVLLSVPWQAAPKVEVRSEDAVVDVKGA